MAILGLSTSEKNLCACLCFEGEGDLLTSVLLIFFWHIVFPRRYFLSLLPFVIFSSDAYFTFHCLGMFFFKFEN